MVFCTRKLLPPRCGMFVLVRVLKEFQMFPREVRNPSRNKHDGLRRRKGNGGCTSTTLRALAITVLFTACNPNSPPKPHPLPTPMLPRMPPIKPIPNPDPNPDREP